MENIKIDNLTIGMTEEEVKEFLKIQKNFLRSYFKNKDKVPLEAWLNNELKKYLPEKTTEEVEKFTSEILETLECNEKNKISLEKAVNNGMTKEVWFANELKHSLKDLPNSKVIEYLDNLDMAVKKTNEAMYYTVTTKSGAINQNFNLDGFIAEQKHVNSFNLDATSKNSEYIAEVLVPKEGQTYGKNSVDVIVKDKIGKVVQRYQAKYGKTAKDTIRLLKDGNYNNQRFLVPKEQVAEVQKAFPKKSVQSEIAIDNVKGNGISKSEMKNLQQEVQEGNIKIDDWNVLQTKQVAVGIAQSVAYAGIQGMAMGAGIEIATKFLNGEEIESDVVIESALRTGGTMGINAAVTGALKVGVEKGLIKIIPKGTPAGILTNIVYVGVENAKILYKVARGELTLKEGIEKIEETTVSMVYGMSFAAEGAVIGAAIGMILGPIGAGIGGLIGGAVGYFAGSKVGKAIVKTGQVIREKAKGFVGKVGTVARGAWNGIKSGVSTVGRGFASVGSGIVSFLGF